MDKLTQEQRRKNMQAVKNKDSAIELKLRSCLWSKNLRYRKNYKNVFGKPDIVFIKKKIAIFCDSEFWHGYKWEEKKSEIKSNQSFWQKKIESNIARDQEVNDKLTKEGWIVLRFWGKEILRNTDKCVDIIEKTIKER